MFLPAYLRYEGKRKRRTFITAPERKDGRLQTTFFCWEIDWISLLFSLLSRLASFFVRMSRESSHPLPSIVDRHTHNTGDAREWPLINRRLSSDIVRRCKWLVLRFVLSHAILNLSPPTHPDFLCESIMSTRIRVHFLGDKETILKGKEGVGDRRSQTTHHFFPTRENTVASGPSCTWLQYSRYAITQELYVC